MEPTNHIIIKLFGHTIPIQNKATCAELNTIIEHINQTSDILP
jgi:hypothetical protein